MTDEFTVQHALELVQRTMALASNHLANDVSICAMAYTYGPLVPTVSVRMGGAEASTVKAAENKCLTALTHQCDTVALSHRGRDSEYGGAPEGQWEPRDVLAMQAAEPTFTPWGGAVLLYNPHGRSRIVGALALSGDGELNEHRIAIKAAYAQGFRF